MNLPDDCRIDIPGPDDWQVFARMAAADGWRVPDREPAWYQQTGPGNAYVLRREDETVGFVSCMPHAGGGWIGNLIVDREHRGQGLGRLLFHQALDALYWQGVSRIWLTASEQGEPLYLSCGFSRVGRVERRVGHGTGKQITATAPQPDEQLWQRLLELDRRAWGEERGRFLNRLREGSCLLHSGNCLLLLQQHGDFSQLGPWYADGCAEADLHEVLRQAMALVETDNDIVIDVPDRSPALAVLDGAGFTGGGEVGLMLAGRAEPPAPDRLLALASLGSAG